jgi:voltage-gated potassium channel
VRWIAGNPTARPGARDPSPGRRARLALGVLIALTLVGTLGFMLVEKLGFLDALYMAVITLSTVGYQEVAPTTPAGRIYTIVFIFAGVGTALYAVMNIAEYLIDGRLREALGRRSMDRTIQALESHVIVCGFGRLGKVVVEELEQAGTSLVVIDSDPTLESDLETAGRLHVVGSALEDSVLRQAGIERATALVAAMPSDPDNVFVALSARELNPRIAVHARAESPPGVRRLRLAGAQQVISIHRLGGKRIANAIVRPAVVDFIELASPGGGAPIDLEEVVLSEGCAIDCLPLRDLPAHGVRIAVVSIQRAGEPTTLIPSAEDVLRAGDHVVVVGDRENVRNLALLAEAT